MGHRTQRAQEPRRSGDIHRPQRRPAGQLDHEFLVIKTTRPADRLPLIGGLVDEPVAGTDVGAIDDIAPGQTKRLTVALNQGHYALICNNPGPPPHYRSGQHTDFWVS